MIDREKITRSDVIFLLLIFLITVLMLWKPLTSPEALLYSEHIPLVLNVENLNNQANYTNVEKYFDTVSNPFSIVSYFIYHKLLYPASVSLESNALTKLAYVVPILCLTCVVYFFCLEFSKKRSVAFFQVLLFIFSLTYFDLLFIGNAGSFFGASGGFLFLLFFVKYLHTSDTKHLLYLALSSLIATMHVGYFYTAIIACGIYFLLHILYSNISRKELLPRYWKLGWGLLLILLLNSYWLTTLPIYEQKLDTFGTSQDHLAKSYHANASFINSFKLEQPFSKDPLAEKVYAGYNSWHYSMAYFIFVCLVLFFALKRSSGSRELYPILGLFVFFLTLSAGVKFDIYNHVTGYIPGWVVLRNQNRIYIFNMLMLIVLSGTVLNEKIRWSQFLVILYIGYSAYVFFQSGLYDYHTNLPVPSQYYQIADFLSQDQNKHKGVLVLPEMPYSPRPIWNGKGYYTVPLFENLLSNPTILNYWGRGRSPAYFHRFFDKQSRQPEAEYLGSAGIKFIIVQKDLLHLPPGFDLSGARGITKIRSGSQLDLFEITEDYLPTIYASNNVQFTRINPSKYHVKMDVKNKTELIFNKPANSKWNIYLRKPSASVPCTSSETYPIAKTASFPGISGFSGATAVECRSAQIFFEGEELQYLFGNPVFEEATSVANNYAKAWSVDPEYIRNHISREYYRENPDGSLEVELVVFFKPQAFFYAGLIVSSLTFISLLASFVFLRLKKQGKSGHA